MGLWSWYKGFNKRQMDRTKKKIERTKTDWENLKKEKDNFTDTVKETKENWKETKENWKETKEDLKKAKEDFKEETKENWKETKEDLKKAKEDYKDEMKETKEDWKKAKEDFKENWKETKEDFKDEMKENWKQAKSEWKDEEDSMKDEEDVLVKGNFWKTLALFPFRLLISPLSWISYSVGYVLIDMRKNFQELAGDNWFFFYVFALVTGWVVAVPLALTFGFFRTLRYVITGRKIERPQSDYELKGQNTTVVRLEENVASELEKFAELKEKGIISEEEFVKKKEELLK